MTNILLKALNTTPARLVLLFIVAVFLFTPVPAFCIELAIEGTASGYQYHKDSFKWTKEPIRVFALYDKKYLDDFTLIVGGRGENKVTGLLVEHGKPGEANTDSVREREKFVSLLKKSQGWLKTATKEQVRETRYLSRIFMRFNVNMIPGEDDTENRLRIKIKGRARDKRIVLHLNAFQVGQLIALLEQTPEAFMKLSDKYGKRSIGGYH